MNAKLYQGYDKVVVKVKDGIMYINKEELYLTPNMITFLERLFKEERMRCNIGTMKPRPN